MKIIILGAGQVGASVAANLASEWQYEHPEQPFGAIIAKLGKSNHHPLMTFTGLITIGSQ